MRFQGVRLLVEDFAKSFLFYRDILGFKALWGNPQDVYASFDTGGNVGISIFESKLMDQSIGLVHKGQRRKADNAVIIIQVEDVDQIYQNLKDKVEVVSPPRDMAGWGCRTLHIRDVEGNLLEFNASLAKDKWDDELLEAAEIYNK